jgi:hypothetical protein
MESRRTPNVRLPCSRIDEIPAGRFQFTARSKFLSAVNVTRLANFDPQQYTTEFVILRANGGAGAPVGIQFLTGDQDGVASLASGLSAMKGHVPTFES